MFAIVIVSLILAVYYRLGAVAIGSFSIITTYLALVFSVLFSVEFNVASIIGLVGVAVASLLLNVNVEISKLCFSRRLFASVEYAPNLSCFVLPRID